MALEGATLITAAFSDEPMRETFVGYLAPVRPVPDRQVENRTAS